MRIAILLGIVTAFTLRLYRLGLESLWYDETVSATLARQQFPEMLAHTSVDIHPPAYYAMLHVWAALTSPFTGQGLEFLLAFPSAVFGVISIALLIPLGRRLLSRPIAVAAVWLAAINPFLIWYGQEVRMYTVAGALGLLCLLAALQFMTKTASVRDSSGPAAHLPGPAWAWLAVYVVIGAAGLYTLYYVAFGLLAINIAVLATVIGQARAGHRIRSTALAWVGAQAGIGLLFLIWLPIFARQILDPPVPPWRVPWDNVSALLHDVGAALAAFIVGQSIPDLHVWLWAGIVILIFAAYVDYAKYRSRLLPSLPASSLWLPLYVVVPSLTIFAASLIAVPIFHVRYLAIFAPAFALITAAGLWRLYAARRALFALLGIVLLLGSTYSVSRFWRNPLYQPEDHRSAVHTLAEAWRPGDVILANAGWIYTAIDTYWPSSVQSADDAVPRSPITWTRMTNTREMSASADGPLGVTTGSVDGNPSLGWGSADADFYSISVGETESALSDLAGAHPRTWHYRLYDTVSDPDGVIRSWLDTNQELRSSIGFGGLGNLVLEEYEGAGSAVTEADGAFVPVVFENAVSLHDAEVPEAEVAGAYLYVPVVWQPEPDYVSAHPLAVSLRLTDADGTLWAQHDEPLVDLTSNAVDGTGHRQTLALPIPGTTPPGSFELRLVIYRPDTLEPLQASTDDFNGVGSLLSRVRIDQPQEMPASRPRASFDYVGLADVSVPTASLTPGQEMHLDLVWRPALSNYRDAYGAHYYLIDDKGTRILLGDDALGPAWYPSSVWPPELPVRDQVELKLPDDIVQGDYRVWLEVFRQSDGRTIPYRRFRWLPFTRDLLELGSVTVEG